jgi:protein-tyrosine phosphatase
MLLHKIYSVSVICLGNICRSPIGEVVLRDRLEKNDLAIEVSSGGTGDWHIGENANSRSIEVLEENNYKINHTAKQVTRKWFEKHDLFLAMDLNNRANLLNLAGANQKDKILMFRWFDESLNHLPIDHSDLEVPDPYYGSKTDFENVLQMIEAAADGFVKKIKQGR